MSRAVAGLELSACHSSGEIFSSIPDPHVCRSCIGVKDKSRASPALINHHTFDAAVLFGSLTRCCHGLRQSVEISMGNRRAAEKTPGLE